MSSFLCETRNAEIIDTPKGYVTSCPLYPLEDLLKVEDLHLLKDCHRFIEYYKELNKAKGEEK